MSITSYAPGSGRRVQPRSRMASSAAEVDLSGTWRFRYSARPDLAPAGTEAQEPAASLTPMRPLPPLEPLTPLSELPDDHQRQTQGS